VSFLIDAIQENTVDIPKEGLIDLDSSTEGDMGLEEISANYELAGGHQRNAFIAFLRHAMQAEGDQKSELDSKMIEEHRQWLAAYYGGEFFPNRDPPSDEAVAGMKKQE
jgi:hypothetical protein